MTRQPTQENGEEGGGDTGGSVAAAAVDRKSSTTPGYSKCLSLDIFMDVLYQISDEIPVSFVDTKHTL